MGGRRQQLGQQDRQQNVASGFGVVAGARAQGEDEELVQPRVGPLR